MMSPVTPVTRKNGLRLLLRSIAILEYLLSNSPHNYDALLILVRLYMYMGAGSLAMGALLSAISQEPTVYLHVMGAV